VNVEHVVRWWFESQDICYWFVGSNRKQGQTIVDVVTAGGMLPLQLLAAEFLSKVFSALGHCLMLPASCSLVFSWHGGSSIGVRGRRQLGSCSRRRESGGVSGSSWQPPVCLLCSLIARLCS
jgi:hypothetical protein